MYEYQGFHSGEKLKATQLVAMEDGIIHAEQLAMEVATKAPNVEKGIGENATQQIPRADKVTQAEGEEILHFNFAGHPDAGMTGRIPYGAVGNYSASINGRSVALSKHAFAINNSTIAKGEESFAQGYETIAEGNSSFAGGTRTWAKGAASVALGDRTKALGEYSFANGVYTVAGHAYQTVVGVANDNNVESLFEVGNGKLDVDGNVVEQSTAFRVMRNGKVKIKDIWAKDDDDVIALGFLNHRLNEELLPPLEEDIKNINAELNASRPYLVLKSNRADKTSAQLAACTASGAHSVAFGHAANATADYTSALGKNVSATALYAIAMGVNSSATNEADFAAGVNAVASGAHSRALGTNVNAGYAYQTIIGKNNANKENTLFEIGNGVDTNNRSNAFEVYSDGLVATGKKVQQLPDGVANGFDFTGKNSNATALDSTLTGIIPYGAVGEFASSFGGKSSAQGKRSHAEGTTTIAKGKYSHAEGDNSVALGDDSHAEGNTTVSKGNGAHSEGYLTIALGNFSHAEGCETSSQNTATHAEGYQTVAAGDTAHAEGNNTSAGGNQSHAEGYKTIANGDCAHAEGHTTVASGNHSHASGYHTQAKEAEQFVIGRLNRCKTNTIFEIGNGFAIDGAPEASWVHQNAFEVYDSGDVGICYNGQIYSLHKILEKLSVFTTDNLK